MNKALFTKGDWKVVEWNLEYPQKELRIYSTEGVGLIATMNGVIDTKTGKSNVTLPQKANADLIASAPTMYAILKRIRDLIDSGDWQLPEGFCETEKNQIDDALAKAKGG